MTEVHARIFGEKYLCILYFLIMFLNQQLQNKKDGSFPFDGLLKNEWKIHISIVFFHDLSENQLHILEKWLMKNEKNMSFWSYIFPMCLLRKAILFFPILQFYILIHWKDFVFVSWIPGVEIYFIRNKSSSL